MDTSGRAAEPVNLALDVVRGALRFYRQQWLLVIGLSAVVSAERVIVQLAGARLPEWSQMPLELAVTAVRALLLVLVFRRMIIDDPDLRGLRLCEGWQRVKRFAGRSWGGWVVQAILLSVCIVAFDIIPEAAIVSQVPPDSQPAYWAALLAIKNPTILAFVLIW